MPWNKLSHLKLMPGGYLLRIFLLRVNFYNYYEDLILNEETKRNLQSAAIQKRVSEANIISAKADVEAAKMLKETS